MTRLSNRQFPMLRMFAEVGDALTMSIHEAQKFDQRPFRSMLIRQWIRYSTRLHGFVITREGRQAWEEFQETSIQRLKSQRPLTAYFDPTAYHLKDPYAEKLTVMPVTTSTRRAS